MVPVQVSPRPRVNGENQWNSFGDLLEGPKNFIELFGMIDIRGAMQSRQRERSAVNAQATQNIRLPCSSKALSQGINHQIANHMNALVRDALIQQIPAAAFFGHQQEVRNRICYNAVYFFRHALIEAPKPSLDMEDWHLQFDGNHRSGHRGVNVAHNNDAIRLYGQRLTEWRRTIESFCARHGMGYVPIDTSTAVESLIFDVLRRRGVVR